MTDGAIGYGVNEGIAEIVLARPPVNALDLATVRSLIAALERARQDAAVRAVIIGSATPGRFCAGLDLGQVQGRSTLEMHELLSTLYVALHQAQAGLGKPSIAAIDGAARGAGMTIAISCDVLVCDADATFGYPEIDVGLIPGIHFAHLPRIVGKHRAFELLFSGRAFDAAEAASLGLVSRVVPAGQAMAQARAMARMFAAKPPTVMRLARAAFVRTVDMGYERSVAEVVETFCTIAGTEEAREGVAAFAARRAPGWAK
ncbi:enoyl-CoA hydratase/isomerase family protein [Bordetella bronchiseptica]|uniref:enoyl-CoA hydratase/isomerase family protein n=1 Tax=Bordetella bronchiseptica TaxID=518 RepID=UPI00081CA992|nr:enoyl-CoA hydratase/isomerase family protein [Bordetella bronchiseptica]AOB25621.1 enoyl-CoA hydratase [Bordetella bronchiseptica]AZW42883.1 enoyl-CoA hydratase/isomerase family protein [Bordetella bronchiseptica]